jgi:MATE family, multidrug efflux pump
LKSRLEILKREFPPLAKLAWPIALANLGWMTMGIVDTMMVGRLSAEAIGAVSLGSVIFSTAGIFGGGVLLGLDALVPQSYGAGDVADCHRSLLNSMYLAIPLSALLMVVLWVTIPLLKNSGVNPSVLVLTIPFLKALIWGTPPLLLYFALREYLQGMDVVKPVMFVLISANAVNAFGDWVLIFGHLGAPAMGAVGSAWVTTFSRVYMAGALGVWVWYYDHRHATSLFEISLRPDWQRVRRLFRLGLPAAMQILVEIGVFAVATTLIGKLNAVSLAAHQIAMNTVTMTYMVPLGVGAAAAVRVGQALGRGDTQAARESGWAALAVGASFMACAAVGLWLAPAAIARIYTPEAAVIRASVSLLVIAGFFQMFDGMQVVATGALRGAGDTHTAMICHLFAYWGLGLPLGYFLCFSRGWGASGLWIGLAIALIAIGIFLAFAWHRKTIATL